MRQAGMRMRWHGRDGASCDVDGAEELAGALDIHPLAARLLMQRGIRDVEAAKHFLQPRLTQLHDPALLPGAARAGERLAQAVRDHQPIIVYGDYDVDGVTAAAILYHVLRELGGEVQTYVPHRVEEGYGLNEAALRSLIEAARQLPVIVSVDCGITAVACAKLAKSLGVDLIICDHHAFDAADLPEAYALVHPGLGAAGFNHDQDETHTEVCSAFGDLCGAGVAFKVAWQTARAFCGCERLPGGMSDLLVDLLSFVALGTVADVVPLVDENRVLTYYGLGRIKRTRFAGLNALIAAARLEDEKVDAYHIGFVLGPRLNACGRMGHAREAVRLLTTATGKEAAELAEFLTKENDRRRTTQRTIFDQAKQMVVERGYDGEEHRAIVLAKKDWHPGVIGIVASKLVETFHRPVVMLNLDNGDATGSARSVDGVSIHEALTACGEHLSKFGGHAMAAGLTLPSERVDDFRAQLVAWINERLPAEALTATLHVDASIALGQCRVKLFEQLQKLAPFGRGNPSPRLLLENVRLDQPAQRMGRNGDHLSLVLRDGGVGGGGGKGGGGMMRAVAFNMGDLAEQLVVGTALDVVFQPKVSTWQGSRRAELHVQDVRVREGVFI